MNPVDRAGPLTGTNIALSSYEKIQPSFRDEKRPKILGTSFGAKLEKQTKMAKRNLVQVANDVETHQAKQNDAIRATLLRDETALLRHRPFNACAIAKNSSR